jgi:hypothetical protein
MTEETRTTEFAHFLDKALDSGVPHDSVVGMLAARGWREKDIYAGLADHFRRTTGLEVPRSRGGGAGARDAFFYLLIFSTLGIWTTELGSLAFTLIDRWLPDPLYSQYGGFSLQLISWSLAAMLIAFPVFLFTSRIVAREASADPGRLESPIRKWLTYIALLLAALVCVSDLICALAFLLRGEITSRFLAKALVVLILAGGVFLHYYGGLRKSEAPARRNRSMAAVAAAAVALMAVLGFTQLGPPRQQRELHADGQRLSQLYRLSQFVESRYATNGSKLPPNLDQFQGQQPIDPVTHARFEYIPSEGSAYQLCANFSARTPANENSPQTDNWTHPAGHFCFQLDARQTTSYPSASYLQ